MKIVIKNMLGVSSQEINLQPGIPHAITGINASGKTSIVAVIAALAARSSNPFHVNVSQKTGYIKRGERDGYAYLQLPEGDIGWSTSDGIKGLDLVLSDKSAVGLIDLVNARASSKTRIEVWESILGANEISTDILIPYFEGREEKEYQAVCDVINREGWNAAADLYVAHRRSKKSEWERVVGKGQKYSKLIAAKYCPSGWLPEDEKTDTETLEGELAELRNLLDAARSESAVSEQQVQYAIEAKERIVELTNKFNKKRQETDALRNENVAHKTAHHRLIQAKDNLQKDVNSLNWKSDDGQFFDAKSEVAKNYAKHSQIVTTLLRDKDALLEQIKKGIKNSLTCPHCDKMFVISQNGAIKWDKEASNTLENDALALQTKVESHEVDMKRLFALGETEIQKRIKALKVKISKAGKAIEASSVESTTLSKNGNAHIAELTRIKARIEELERIAQYADSTVKVGATEQAITDLRMAVEQKQQAIINYKLWFSARQSHDAVCANDYIVKVLSPGGAKDKVMQERFGKIESIIKNVVDSAKWSDVSIDAKFGVSIAGTAAAFASKSERWRAQVALQIAVFIFTKSKVLVLDECDILDGFGFDGLMRSIDRISAKFNDRYFVFAGTTLEDIPEKFNVTEIK